MKVVVIADTHGFQQRLTIPAGDVLVVAGDICPFGTLVEIKEFGNWLREQPCKHKIVVAGNHDAPFEHEQELAQDALIGGVPGIIYLQDSSVKIDDVKFYGSPWTPTFMDWHFMADRGAPIRGKWEMIPEDTDVLITHGPPSTILDKVRGVPLGCHDLLEMVLRIRPKYHLFGHIHQTYGTTRRNGITFINASVCDGRYRPVNEPIVFDL